MVFIYKILIIFRIFLKNYSRKQKSCTKIYIKNIQKYTKVSIKAYLVNYK